MSEFIYRFEYADESAFEIMPDGRLFLTWPDGRREEKLGKITSRLSGNPGYPSVEAMKAAVELEILSALGQVQTVAIGQMIQKAIDASSVREG